MASVPFKMVSHMPIGVASHIIPVACFVLLRLLGDHYAVEIE